MVKIFGSVSPYPSERRDHEQFSGFQSGRDNSLAKFGQIVFICSSDFFDKAVHMKPFEHARYLMGGFAGKVFSDSAVAQAADVEFAPCNSVEQIQIIAVKKVEAAIAAAIVADGARNLFDVFLGRARIINGGDEIDIAAVGSAHQFGKHIQTVDAFLQRRKLHLADAVAMFHPAVVFEKVTSLTVVSIRSTRPCLSYILIATGPMWCLMRVPWIRVLKSLPNSS